MTREEIAKKVSELRELMRMADELSAEIEALKDDLKAEMNDGNGYELKGTDYKVTYHEVSQTKIDSKALKKDLPDVAAKYSKTSSYRRFLLA